MSRRLLFVAALVALTAGMAVAQVGIGIGDPVILRTVPPATTQGVTYPPGAPPTDYLGNPANGRYDILINGWIEAFAYVSVWDNWISFGVMDPDTGTYASPYSRWAFSQTGEATYASTGTNWNAFAGGVEDGGQDPLYQVHSSTLNFDLAGFRVDTNARLDLDFDMGGFMTRCESDGSAFAGNDTRRDDSGPYQLANQYKICFKGKFLEYVDPGDPAQDEDGTAYVSPTSGETTAYNFLTDWDDSGTSPGAIANNDGWIWPVPATQPDPWTGEANLAYVDGQLGGAHTKLEELTIIVERGQAQGTNGSVTAPASPDVPDDLGADGPSEAAEVWFAERVMRRGLQDVAGNYRADRLITLTYREADAPWTP